jgi:transglutaminase-like putative cysteine protease
MELVVADKRRRNVEIGGSALPSEDQFYGDLFVDVVPGVPVRIPSVGAGTRVLAARVEPSSPFELVRDGADNFFLLGTERKRVRLILQLSIPRSVFGSPYPDVGWGSLEKQLPAVPPSVKAVARDVIGAIGLSTSVKPRDALATLVGYFRGFAPSEDVPQARASLELYREIALSKKGVCRHRSYAFVVTALGLGLPARLVRNEAHAWIEVGDGTGFHRIDLGGAATRFEVDDASARVTPHAPPEDPYSWPEGSEARARRSKRRAHAPRDSSPARPVPIILEPRARRRRRAPSRAATTL